MPFLAYGVNAHVAAVNIDTHRKQKDADYDAQNAPPWSVAPVVPIRRRSYSLTFARYRPGVHSA